jgi:pseudaminic acid biosynthesis-associated methylase
VSTAQEKFWEGDFGTAYTARNDIAAWRARIPFWHQILELTKPHSILEIGCNAGLNLNAIRHVDTALTLCGCDINQEALRKAARQGHNVVEASVFDLSEDLWERFDLTFTAGVLIHIAPADVERAMRSIIASSKRHVLAVEYADDKEVEVPYRGHSERLWRRPFGQMYQDLGLKLVAEGEAPTDAFDRCNWWCLKK